MKIPEKKAEVLKEEYTYKYILVFLSLSTVLYKPHISGSSNTSRLRTSRQDSRNTRLILVVYT